MITKKKFLFGTMVLSCISFGTAEVKADQISVVERNRELSVLSRVDPSLRAKGIQAGRFNIFPRVQTSAEYTDNLYSSETLKLEDYVFAIKPSIIARSNFDRHQINFTMNAEQTFHKNNDAEDYTEYLIGTGVRYDIGGGFSVPFNVDYSQDTTRRGTPDEEGALEATEFNVFRVGTGINYSGQLLNFGLNARFRDLSFEDTLTGTGIRNNQDRNRDETTLNAQLGLSAVGGIVPFIYGEYKDVSYDNPLDDGGFGRDSSEYEGGIGTRFQLSSLTGSEFRIGYSNYESDDTRFDDVNDVNFLANITWEPTPLTALSLTGERNVAETTVGNFSSSVDSELQLSGTYELTPSIYIRPRVEYLEKEYDSNNSLERMTYGLNINYTLNDNASAAITYNYTDQEDPDNSAFISDYVRNNFLVSLQLQF